MHSTHQFFLSKRSLYVLVLDGRKEEDAEYWLQHIRTFGGSSPILVILNKIDENPRFEVNRKFLQDKYPAIAGFYRISCRTDEGISLLTEAMRQTVAEIEHLKTIWPQPWFKVKLRLEHMKEDYISYERYEAICHAEGIAEESTAGTLIDFLNDLGVVLHFDSPVLKETNIINPSWVTGAIYQIINSQALAEGNGRLQHRTLRRV